MARTPGTAIVVGNRTLTVPALTLRQFEAMAPKLKALEQMGDDPIAAVQNGALSDALDIIHEAVSRNHPEITRDQLGDLVDLRNLSAFTMAATGASAVTPGEAQSPESA